MKVKKILNNIMKDKASKKKEKEDWVCTECGTHYISIGPPISGMSWKDGHKCTKFKKV